MSDNPSISSGTDSDSSVNGSDEQRQDRDRHTNIDTDSDDQPFIDMSSEEVDSIRDQIRDIDSEKPTAPKNADPDFDYEAQEWTLGGYDKGEVTVDGMRFLLSEPATEDDLDQLLIAASGRVRDDRQIVESIVEAPTITDDRWHAMSVRQQRLLSFECAEWINLEAFFSASLEEAYSDADGEEDESGSPSDVGMG